MITLNLSEYPRCFGLWSSEGRRYTFLVENLGKKNLGKKKNRLPSIVSKIYRELQNSESMERMLSKLYFERRSKIEEMCSAAGFEIIKSVDVKMEDQEFENVESLCSFILATNQGRFVSELATRDKVSRFCAQYTSGESSKPLTVYTDEGDYYCVLIAAKP